ncbi:MAG: hypothetical protein V4772_25570, partial [Pseudomonadota bacterium]
AQHLDGGRVNAFKQQKFDLGFVERGFCHGDRGCSLGCQKLPEVKYAGKRGLTWFCTVLPLLATRLGLGRDFSSQKAWSEASASVNSYIFNSI